MLGICFWGEGRLRNREPDRRRGKGGCGGKGAGRSFEIRILSGDFGWIEAFMDSLRWLAEVVAVFLAFYVKAEHRFPCSVAKVFCGSGL